MRHQKSEDDLARAVAEALFRREGTGAVWGVQIEEVRVGYARLSMQIRADMTNGHAMVHGGMIFALADTAFAYACNSANEATVGQAASIVYLAPAHDGEVLVAEAKMVTRTGRTGVASVQVSVKGIQRVIAHFQGQSRTIGGHIVDPRKPG